jgi:hypothetical protein
MSSVDSYLVEMMSTPLEDMPIRPLSDYPRALEAMHDHSLGGRLRRARIAELATAGRHHDAGLYALHCGEIETAVTHLLTAGARTCAIDIVLRSDATALPAHWLFPVVLKLATDDPLYAVAVYLAMRQPLSAFEIAVRVSGRGSGMGVVPPLLTLSAWAVAADFVRQTPTITDASFVPALEALRARMLEDTLAAVVLPLCTLWSARWDMPHGELSSVVSRLATSGNALAEAHVAGRQRPQVMWLERVVVQLRLRYPLQDRLASYPFLSATLRMFEVLRDDSERQSWTALVLQTLQKPVPPGYSWFVFESPLRLSSVPTCVLRAYLIIFTNVCCLFPLFRWWLVTYVRGSNQCLCTGSGREVLFAAWRWS